MTADAPKPGDRVRVAGPIKLAQPTPDQEAHYQEVAQASQPTDADMRRVLGPTAAPPADPEGPYVEAKLSDAELRDMAAHVEQGDGLTNKAVLRLIDAARSNLASRAGERGVVLLEVLAGMDRRAEDHSKEHSRLRDLAGESDHAACHLWAQQSHQEDARSLRIALVSTPAQPEVDGGWRDMASAPRDGTSILWWTPDGSVGVIRHALGVWRSLETGKRVLVDATDQWHPLPAPPKPAETGEGRADGQ